MTATELQHAPASAKALDATHTHKSRPVAFFSALVVYVLVIIVVMLVPPVPTRTSYLAAIIDKMKALNSAKGSRLIIVGGSSAAFGVDSELASKQLRKPVVNMGLHASLGMRYMTKEILPYLRAGDVVVLIPEYEQYSHCLNGNTELAEMLFVYPRGVAALSPENVPALVRAVPRLIKRKIEVWKKYGVRNLERDPIYDRDGFNQLGDHISHIGRVADHAKFPTELRLTDRELDPGAINTVTQFREDCAQRGAKMFVAFGPVPQFAFQNRQTLERIEDINGRLQKELGTSVLLNPASSAYPSEDFFDTPHHLVGSAREKFTLSLIQALQHVL